MTSADIHPLPPDQVESRQLCKTLQVSVEINTVLEHEEKLYLHTDLWKPVVWRKETFANKPIPPFAFKSLLLCTKFLLHIIHFRETVIWITMALSQTEKCTVRNKENCWSEKSHLLLNSSGKQGAASASCGAKLLRVYRTSVLEERASCQLKREGGQNLQGKAWRSGNSLVGELQG